MESTRDQERALHGAVRKDRKTQQHGKPVVFIAKDEPSLEAALKCLEKLRSAATSIHDLYEELLMELMLADNPRFKSTPNQLMGEFEPNYVHKRSLDRDDTYCDVEGTGPAELIRHFFLA